MNVQAWDVPIQASWQKSNTLVDLSYDIDGLDLIIAEEETRARWRVEFDDVVAFKVITDEYAKWSMQPIPADGGFFEITESPWLTALGLTESADLEVPHHFVICCRREIIEVAAYGVSFAAQ